MEPIKQHLVSQLPDPLAAPLMPPIPCGYVKEPWLWEANDQCPSVELSHGRQEVYFHTDPVMESSGTAGVRGDTGFLQGEHYWEIEFMEPPSGLSVMVGVGTCRAPLCAGSFQYLNLLGLDADSWGLSYKGKIWHAGSSKPYTEPFYEEGTVIGVHLNMEGGTLTFYKDRQSLGLAFTGLHKVQLPLFPMVSSTSPGTELALGLRCCTLPTLEERCLSTLARNLTRKDSTDLLPLPAVVRWKLKRWKNWDVLRPEL
ncbi:SPRY domain-containing SOCS box protein 3-like isoform X1 [Rhinoderma darwinii]|uniref:SPRY domain-containing SOCS box protein 3-like isoform X1 n=1 Tax=Rhinoderma darwinii TaxID=43563 RepID=UPI003F67E530